MPCVSIKSKGLKTKILSSRVLAHMQKLQESHRLEFKPVLNLRRAGFQDGYQKLHMNLKSELENQSLGF